MPDHAVVLGAGIAGLAAAAVLAEHYTTVTIVERDHLPDRPIDRRKLPQGPHMNRLLSRGSQLLDEFLPGFRADLTTAGALVLDEPDTGQIYTRNGPYTLDHSQAVSDPAALITYQASRPFLEFHLRRRVAALPNVTVRESRSGLGYRRTGERVTGVEIIDWDSGRPETLTPDLVVDATGRASWTPYLLETLGYLPPRERTISEEVVYHSQRITIPESDSFRERTILVLSDGAGRRGGLVACENDTWILTVQGGANDSEEPPKHLGDMLAAAEGFMPAHVLPALRRAQAASDVSSYRYPGGVWRRYDRLARHPAGLVVIGDALCSLDPLNGQGITMATLQVDILRRLLNRSNSLDPQEFYREAAKLIKPLWARNAMPAIGAGAGRGAISLVHRVVHWGQSKVLEAAAGDAVVAERLMRVANLVDPPKRVPEPAFVARVAAHHARQLLADGARKRSGGSTALG